MCVCSPPHPLLGTQIHSFQVPLGHLQQSVSRPVTEPVDGGAADQCWVLQDALPVMRDKKGKRLQNIPELDLLSPRGQSSSRSHLKSSPTGLMHIMTCRLLLTRSIRYRKRESGVCSTLSRLASSDRALHTFKGHIKRDIKKRRGMMRKRDMKRKRIDIFC